MKKTTFLLAFVFSFMLFSCDDDDDLKLTNTEGLPGYFEKNDEEKYYYTYQRNKITQIKSERGNLTKYAYENGIPSEILYFPPPEAVDGNGSVRFKKDGNNKIRIESWGEPSSHLYVQEIELDNTGNPVKITYLGAYEQQPEGLVQIYEAVRYVNITIDPITKNLMKREEYSLESGELLATYTYEYDNNPGTMSRIDLPLWFFVYCCDARTTFYEAYNRQYFNYRNNLIKETVDNKIEGLNYTVDYTYTYNNNGYPLSATNNQYAGENKVIIKY